MKPKILVLIAAVVGSAAFAQSKSADGSSYAEVGAVMTNYNIAGYSFSSANSYGLRVGQNLSDNLAVEAVYSSGMSDSTYSSTSTGALTYRNRGSYGLYVKPKAKINNDLEVFGRAGFFRSNGTLKSSSASADNSDDAFSYGLGVSYNISKTVYTNLDYTNFYNKDSTNINGFGLSVGFKF
jgi:opacity protein-like surface antigen